MIVEVPRKIKFGRAFKIRLKKYELVTTHGFLCDYKLGLKVLESCKVKYFHLKSINMVLKRIFKKRLKIKLNVSFCYPVTKKPEQTRMGKGKGKRSYWASYIKKGEIILEIDVGHSIPDINLLNGLCSVSYKLPFKCKFVKLWY